MVYAMYRSEGLAEVRQHGLLQGKRRSPGPAVAQGGGDEVDNSWTVCGRHTAVRRHCADRCSAMLSVCVDVFLMVSQGWVDASRNVTHRVYCHVSCTVCGMCSSNISSSSSTGNASKATSVEERHLRLQTPMVVATQACTIHDFTGPHAQSSQQ